MHVCVLLCMWSDSDYSTTLSNIIISVLSKHTNYIVWVTPLKGCMYFVASVVL